MSIPASDIVSVQPGVLSAGGSPLSLNGVILTQNDYVPTNAVPSFTSADAVSDYFGPASDEYALSQIYFNGYNGSTIKPGTLWFAPFAEADRAAWLQGGSLAGMTLTELQALSGVLTVTVDGTGFTSGTINLATATSFSNAATLINSGFTGTGKPVASWDSIKSVFVLTSPTTGATSTIGFCTGTLSAGLKFTEATGAIVSPGADEDTADTAMNRITGITQNWATFMTVWEPDTAGKLEFADWVNSQNQRYAYSAWDTDAQASVNGSTTTFGYQVSQLDYNGVIPLSGNEENIAVYGKTITEACRNLAAFNCGSIASIDFSRANARITMKFRAQSGFTPTVTDQQIAENLRNNGYNFYGVWATANDQFSGFAEGSMPGEWLWIDPYVNQIYLNSQFQLSLMDLLFNIGSIPYNAAGYALIRAAMQDPINQMLNFGGIRAGVVLSESQKAQVNTAAGVDAAPIIETQGYYLQVLDPGAQARALRATPIVNFWYTDGGAVHTINVASINIL